MQHDHTPDYGNQTIYEIVVYGNMMKTVAATEAVHYFLREDVEPNFDWAFIIANVITAVSAAGTRVRMLPPHERTLHRYDAELLKAFCLSGFLIHIPIRLLRQRAQKDALHKFLNELRNRRNSQSDHAVLIGQGVVE